VKKALTILVAALITLALLSYMVTFTVRFTESAVKTRFGAAGENDVISQAGLYTKLPWPIDRVTKYDTRVRVLTIKIETQSTKDNRQISVESFCTWRVKDPLKFFKTFSNSGERSVEHYASAEKALNSQLRAASSVISQFSMDELFTFNAQGKLGTLEERMLAEFRNPSDPTTKKLSEDGIEVVDVGVSRIVLPEEVTKAVFNRMKAAQEKIARETQSAGQAQAAGIRAKAEADAKRISDFANRLAQDIRSRGDIESVPFLKQMDAKPELAVFMTNMDLIRNFRAKRTTLVLSGSMPGVSMLFPNALDNLKAGEIPTITPGNWLADAMKTKSDAAAKGEAKNSGGTNR
jgi:membrane protease subunit HflC